MFSKLSLINVIEGFIEHRGLRVAEFAIAGEAADYLLGDIPEMKGKVIDVAFAMGIQGVRGEYLYQGYTFYCYNNNTHWSSFIPMKDNPNFVLSTAARIQRSIAK